MSEIKPALTAEEWANGRTEKGYTFNRVGVDVWFGSPNETDPLMMVQNRHAVAAVCLHDQPFGFTREMVDAVRVLDSLNAMKWDEVKALWVLVRQMTDHVEALLPPEEKC